MGCWRRRWGGYIFAGTGSGPIGGYGDGGGGGGGIIAPSASCASGGAGGGGRGGSGSGYGGNSGGGGCNEMGYQCLGGDGGYYNGCFYVLLGGSGGGGGWANGSSKGGSAVTGAGSTTPTSGYSLIDYGYSPSSGSPGVCSSPSNDPVPTNPNLPPTLSSVNTVRGVTFRCANFYNGGYTIAPTSGSVTTPTVVGKYNTSGAVYLEWDQ